LAILIPQVGTAQKGAFAHPTDPFLGIDRLSSGVALGAAKATMAK
jgi:hypothetical protein